MKINWEVRLKNPIFWVQVVASVFLPVLAYFGLSWEDMTSWQAVGQVLLGGIKNPVVVVTALVSLWNAVNDPTTHGIGDSVRALSYTRPYKEGESNACERN